MKLDRRDWQRINGCLPIRAQVQNMANTAVLGDEAHCAPALWALAVDQHLPTAQTSSVTSDGAEWIWNLADDLFPDGSQIVDWFHACQHSSQLRLTQLNAGFMPVKTTFFWAILRLLPRH